MLAKIPDHNRASRPAATATAAGTPVIAALFPLALVLTPEAATDAVVLNEDKTELAALEAEAKAEEEDETEADDACAEEELMAAEEELAALALEADDEVEARELEAEAEADDELAEVAEDATDTAPNMPPSTLLGWLLPRTD